MAIETTRSTRRTKAAQGIVPGAGADLPDTIASTPATEEVKPVSESRPGEEPGVAQNAGADKPADQPSTPATEAAPSSSPSAEDRAPPADTTNPATEGATTGTPITALSIGDAARQTLVFAIEDGRLPDGAVVAILAALDEGSLIATGTDARFVLEPIDDADAALLTPAAHTVIDAIVDGTMPQSVLEAIKATIDDGTMADVGLRTAAAMDARNERLAPQQERAQEEKRSFPVVSDVLNGGALVTAGGIVTVTEPEFVQLRAGLSIPAELRWVDGQ